MISEFMMMLVTDAICREGGYETCTYRVSGDFVIFEVVDFGIELGGYRCHMDWFDKNDAKKLGLAVMTIVNTPLLDDPDLPLS